MKPFFIYPGSFCPPTYGHVEIANRTAALFGKVTVLCSANPDKEKTWFSQEECAEMWQTYNLPQNVAITTFKEFNGTIRNRPSIVMIRGVRDDRDLDYEKEVVMLNYRKFGIVNYLYVLNYGEYNGVSSTIARNLAHNLDIIKLSTHVSPLILTRIIEKTLDIRNLFMVVGKPGSGKTTFLKMLHEKNSNNIYIDTDDFTSRLRPLLENKFGRANLVDIASKHGEKLTRVIEKPWLRLVRNALKRVPRRSNVFLEIPYGLQPDKLAFRFFGGKIIYVGSEDERQNKKRILARGTPHIAKLIYKIPGKKETRVIAKQYKLEVIYIDTNGSLDNLKAKAHNFDRKLQSTC